MWKTIVPAAAVLAAEAVIRRKINALPAETFPLRIGQRVPRPAVQQVCTKAASGRSAADCVRRSARGGGGRVRLPPGRHGAADRHGPDARRRAGQSPRALGARVGHGLCVSAAGGHPVFPAHHLERGRPEHPDRLHHGSDRTAVRRIVIM